MSTANQTPKTAVAVVSLMSVFLLFCLMAGDYVSPTTSLWLLGAPVTLGMIVAAGEVEDWLGGRFLNFHGFRYAAAAMSALLLYLARIDSIGDINHIFHVDASALPLTVWAGTALHIATTLYYPFLAITALAVIGLIIFGFRMFHASGKDVKQQAAGIWRCLAVVFSCGISVFVIHVQLRDVPLRAKLYRIAQSSDFSASFRCIGVPEEGNIVLFIGPEQRRILIAKKIVDPTAPGSVPPFFENTPVPREFPIIDCVAPSAKP